MNTTYPNDILPFGVSGRVENGDVLTLEQYQTDPQRLVGHQPGIARQALENTALRQVSHMAAGLAQYVANCYPGGVRDDGDLDAVERGLLAAVASGLAWSKETDYAVPSLVAHGVKVYVAVAPSGPHASAGPQQPSASGPYWKAVTPDTDGITMDAVDDALTVLAAPKLKTPRTIALYGGATGAASFDGSADARIDVTSLDLGKGAGILPVSKGGTGAATADAARQNLGIVLNNTVEAYRQSRIGTPHHLSSTTLSAGYMWADGSLALFSDWPELAAAYNAGRFAGMLLAWNASSSSKSSYPAMWVPNAANPSGLYLPRLGGLFSRYWTPGQTTDTGRAVGSYEGDMVYNHGHSPYHDDRSWSVQAQRIAGGGEDLWLNMHGTAIPAGINNGIITGLISNGPAGNENRPKNVALPIAIYLGVHA